MTLAKSVRCHPLACLLVALGRWASGRLRRSGAWIGKTLRTGDGEQFEVFRHLSMTPAHEPIGAKPAVLIVEFAFARLSQRANRLASLIPIPAIAGFPGFRDKVWMVDEQTGRWQGVYQWESLAAAEAYQRSFVFGVMNRRAKAGSLTTKLLAATRLSDVLRAPLAG